MHSYLSKSGGANNLSCSSNKKVGGQYSPHPTSSYVPVLSIPIFCSWSCCRFPFQKACKSESTFFFGSCLLRTLQVICRNWSRTPPSQGHLVRIRIINVFRRFCGAYRETKQKFNLINELANRWRTVSKTVFFLTFLALLMAPMVAPLGLEKAQKQLTYKHVLSSGERLK